MGDSLETRINIIDHIQKEFGHDIQEIKGQLARLTKLIEGYTGIVPENIHGYPFFPLQSSLYPLVQHLHPNYEPCIPVVATFRQEFTTRSGNPMRLPRQPFQLLGRRPNLLI